MRTWPFNKRQPVQDDRRLAHQERTHQVMRLFESMCTETEKSAYMAELYRHGYQGGPVFTGIMWNACMKAAPDKLQQADRIIPSSSAPASTPA